MPPSNHVDVTRRVDGNTETLQDIVERYQLHRSLSILLRNELLRGADIQTLVHKYNNLHALCTRGIRQLQQELNGLGSSHLFDACMAVKDRVQNVVHMLQIRYPRATDTALQAAQWEVSIQKSMMRSQTMHGSFPEQQF